MFNNWDIFMLILIITQIQNRLLYLSLYPYSVHLLIIVFVNLKLDITGVMWKLFLPLFNFWCINFIYNTHRVVNSMHCIS